MNNEQKQDIAVVTGANGFVGSHLVDLLINRGFKVRAILRNSSNSRWLDGKDVELHRCGLKNIENLKIAFNDASYIFHIAGVVSAKKKAGYYEGNVATTKNVLEAAENTPSLIKILITSSLAAAGPTVPGSPLTESQSTKLVSTYGKSKKAQEELATSYMSKLPITIVRPPAVFGERDTEILIFFKTVSKGLFTKIGLDEKTLSLVHVKDLVKGMFLAATNSKSAGETYFLGSITPEFSWDFIGDSTSKILDKKPFKLKVPHFLLYVVAAFAEVGSLFSKSAPTLNLEKVNEIIQPSWSCDSEKAIRELGYGEDHPLEERIRQTIKWYQEQKWI